MVLGSIDFRNKRQCNTSWYVVKQTNQCGYYISDSLWVLYQRQGIHRSYPAPAVLADYQPPVVFLGCVIIPTAGARVNRRHQGFVKVDDGIITQEGLYMVRYYVGGSGCCVAESKKFKASDRRSGRGSLKCNAMVTVM